MRKSTLKLFIGIFCTAMFLTGILAIIPVPPADNMRINHDTSDYGTDGNLPSLPVSSLFRERTSPFFNHSDEDIDQYLNAEVLYYHSDGIRKTSFFHHSFNNTENFTIVDDRLYTRDQFYFMKGIGGLVYTGALIAAKYSAYADTPLWDDENGGFYSELYSNFTPVSDTKYSFDNLMALWFLKDGLGGEQTFGIPTNISDLFDRIINLFWDSNIGGFNHSTEDLSVRYTDDNFFAAIVAYETALKPGISDELRDKLIEYADKTMNIVNYTTSLFDKSPQPPSFFGTFDSTTNLVTGSSDKNLMTNALGIIAHLYAAIVHGYGSNSEVVNVSAEVWNFLKDSLYNDTYNMYMSTVTRDGTTVLDYKMDLLENAWMLLATVDLFKVTGNLTYYNAAVSHFYGIEKSLHDAGNYGYNASAGMGGTGLKTTDSYNMLLYTLRELFGVYNSTELSTVTFDDTYVYLNETRVNATVKFGISMDFDYRDTVGNNWSIYVPVENAKITYILRYEENSTVIAENTSITDAEGLSDYNYSLSPDMPITRYTISVVGSASNLADAYMTLKFEIVSGLVLLNVSSMFDGLPQGDTGIVKLDLNSSRYDNLTVTVVCSGDKFAATSSNTVISGNNVTSIYLNVTADENAEPGPATINITIYNGTTVVLKTTYEIIIKAAVKCVLVSYGEFVPITGSVDISVLLKNIRYNSNETVSVRIESAYFVNTTSEAVTLAPASDTGVTVSLEPVENLKLGTYMFTLSVVRNNITIYSENYTIKVVPSVEILHISDLTSIVQGITPEISIRVFGYVADGTYITIRVNGKVIGNYPVLYGENIINIALDNPVVNPYDVSEKQYVLEIVDDSGSVIASRLITVKIDPSVANGVMFYLLPTVLPIALILFYRNKLINFRKRNI